MENEFRKKTIKNCNFYIKVLFRQNASYQGEIEWISGNEKHCRYFRSNLEMICLINEALDIEKGLEANYEIRSWKNNNEFLDNFKKKLEDQ